MKNTLLVIAVLFAGACATKPVRELTLREKVVGTYELELKKFGETQRYVLLDNKTVEYYLNTNDAVRRSSTASRSR